jgi:5-formyltetrahydrofolate cyclo-ligase
VSQEEDAETLSKAGKRLTFPFPIVHHQPHDWKVDQKLMERRTHIILATEGFPEVEVVPILDLLIKIKD